MKRPKAPAVLAIALLLTTAGIDAQTATPTFPDPGKASMSRENQRALGMRRPLRSISRCRCCPTTALSRNT